MLLGDQLELDVFTTTMTTAAHDGPSRAVTKTCYGVVCTVVLASPGCAPGPFGMTWLTAAFMHMSHDS